MHFSGFFSAVAALIKKFRYNLLALLQAIFRVIFSILTVKYFGVSAEMDAYFLTVTIIASLELVLLLFVDTFMQVYNDIKAVDENSAIEFFKSALWFSVLSGSVLAVLSIFVLDYVLMVFVSGIDAQRIALVRSFYGILFITLAFRPFMHVSTMMLNAENRFAAPYIFTMIPHIFGIVGIIFWEKLFGIRALVFSQTFAWLVMFFSGMAYMKASGFPTGFRLGHPKLWYYIKLSFKMRTSHNIYELLKQPITTNLLVRFPAGAASYFYYAQRFCVIIISVAGEPILRIHNARLSKYWARNNIVAIKRLIKSTEIKTVSLVVGVFVVSLFFLKPVLMVVGGANLSSYDIRAIYMMYLLMFFSYLILTIEAPIVYVAHAAKRPVIFFLTNSCYAITYAVFGILLSKSFGFYSIAVALGIAQLICSLSYTFYNLRLLTIEPVSFAKNKLMAGLRRCIAQR